MNENEFENHILQLYHEKKWKEIIFLSENKESRDRHRLLWVWPTITDLNWIKDIIDESNLEGIVSIGCGTGLLEWIIEQHSQCTVIGVEVDQYWWKSRYSPALYLKNMVFIDKKNPTINIPNNYGILFCYFNNGMAFNDYINNYYGKILIIIGPIDGKNRTTNPMPFDTVRLNNIGWKLNKIRKLDNNNDCIAVYIRS